MSRKEKKTIILVGDGDELTSFYRGYNHQDRVEGIFCSETIMLPDGLHRIGNVSDAPGYLDVHPLVGRVYCGISCIPVVSAQSVRNACKMRAVKFCAVLPVVNALDGKFVQMKSGGEMMLTLVNEPLSHAYNRVIKRLFDFLLVLVFMLVFFPFVYIYKAIVIKRKKRGPSFTTQLCYGPDGKTFQRVSFRGEKNSLAQLFNVLVGSMSLVGPEAYELADKESVSSLPKHLERQGMKAGMAGWAQLRHAQDDVRLSADIWYAEHWSLWLDIRLLIQSLMFR